MSVRTRHARGEIVYSARGITKHFGPIQACADLDLDLRAGQLTAIVGDNGAGKTTLVKMLTGALAPDQGSLELRGEPVSFTSPLDARLKGIECVYQELALAPNLDAVANIFLGRELRKTIPMVPVGILDDRRMQRLAAEEISRLNVKIPDISGVPVGQMSGGQRQGVAIARAAYWTSDVLFMDEPTAALGVQESAAVLDLVKSIIADGVAVVMVSHVLPHVVELADHLVVMRHGHKVADQPRGTTDVEGLIRLIVGAA